MIQVAEVELADSPSAQSEEFVLKKLVLLGDVGLGWHCRNEPRPALCWMLKTSLALTKISSFLNVTCRETRCFWIDVSSLERSAPNSCLGKMAGFTAEGKPTKKPQIQTLRGEIFHHPALLGHFKSKMSCANKELGSVLYLHFLSAMGIAERLHSVLADCTRLLLQGGKQTAVV